MKHKCPSTIALITRTKMSMDTLFCD